MFMMNDHYSKILSAFSACFGDEPSSVEQVQAHASQRRIARLGSGRRETVIGSFEPNWREAEAFLYLAEHFRCHGLNVPEILFVDPHRQVILMTDLGNQTLLDFLNHERTGESDVSESVEQMYQRALVDLIHFQYDAGHLVDFSRCYPTASFSGDDMRNDCNLFVRSVIDVLGIPGDQTNLERELTALVESLSKDSSWNTFMYRDFQARNIVIKGKSLGYIDFQGGRRGPPAYDVASLVYQARAGLSTSVRRRLLSIYCKAATDIPGFNEEAFRQQFDEWVLVRLLQAIGRAGELGLQEKKELFRSSLPKGLATLLGVLRSGHFSFKPSALVGFVETLSERVSA